MPKVVIISHAKFHEERNLLTRGFRSRLFMGIDNHDDFINKQFYYSRLVTDRANIISYKYVDILKEYIPFPLRKYSALSNYIDEKTYNFSKRDIESFSASKKIIKEIYDFSVEKHFKLIIVDVAYNYNYSLIEEFYSNNDIHYVNISPDFFRGKYTFNPFDSHPNVKAHAVYYLKIND